MFLTAVLFVTLMVLIVPCLKETSKRPERGYPTNKDMLSLSDNTNVLVFVLDNYDVNFFRETIEEVPEFEEQFDGFIWFDNFAGCYPLTKWAIPFMLSGNYCRQENPYDQVNIDCMERVYWDELVENGYEMSIYSQFELIPPRAGEIAVNYSDAEPVIFDHKAFTVLLYRLVMCKYFPDIVKPSVWLFPYEFEARRRLDSVEQIYVTNNLMLADSLAQETMTADAELPQFKFIHVGGAHPPFSLDEWGYRAEGSNYEEGCHKGALRLVLRYMDKMKELGIYDDTAIIVTADHGDYGKAFTCPVFLVKPCDAHGLLSVNHTPSSQADLGATILDISGIDTDVSAYGVSVFDEEGEREKKRYYYTAEDVPNIAGEPLFILIEHEVDPDGISLEDFHPTGVEYGGNNE